MFPLLKTGRIIEKSGGKIHLAKRDKGRIAHKFERHSIQVHVYDEYPCFAEAIASRTRSRTRDTINFNGEILSLLGEIDPTAKDLLFDLAFQFEGHLLSGGGEKEAYHRLAKQIVSSKGRQTDACLAALRHPEIDPGNTFGDFIESCLLGAEDEKQRLIALLKARLLTDIPYDRVRAYEAERRCEGDLPTLRLQTLDVLANTYDPAVDHENAERVFRHCLAHGKRLLVCRFGRAFYTDALLIADAKGVRRNEVSRELDNLARQYKRIARPGAIEKIGPELQRVLNLGRQEWFPLAGIEGGIEQLKDSLRQLEAMYIEDADTAQDLDGIQRARGEIDPFRGSIYGLEEKVAQAEKFSPSFVTFVSRIHELDAVNVIRVNELLDPFFGENPRMGSLITATGENTTISPNPHAWLPFASDWVEALPAYAHYTILPTDTGYDIVAVTEREILEIVYKTCADDWARNIEDVMAREHVSVARQLVASRYEADPRDETAAIEFVRSSDTVNEVARVAVLVEEVASRRIRALAQLQQEGLTREAALLKLCASRRWTARTHASDERTRLYEAMALENKRPLPTVHVLTTLGPTETETNIANWLEEAMSLGVIERRHDLGSQVEAKLTEYRRTVGEMALQAIQEEELEGEVLTLLSERSLDDEPANRAQVAISIATTYPEISHRVNNAIAEAFHVPTRFANCLRDYVGPLARFTARREVVKQAGLAHLLDDGRYRYASSGPFKRYNLAYTPSRVDLGPDIIESVRNVPKWVGGDGSAAAQSAQSLYALFNVAGVTAVNRPQIAEFLKVGENFFTRGGVYYLSLAAGANVNALGVGEFEFLRAEWNRRGDRTVLPTGETYGGFCVPKEFSLLYAIVTRALNPETIDELMDSFGVPGDASLRERLVEDLLHVLTLRREAKDPLQWEQKATAYLSQRYPEYMPRLPQLTKTLNKAGVLHEDAEPRHDFEIANWKNKKALGMEEINRSGVFDKVRLVNVLAKNAAQNDPDVSLDRMIGVMGAGYKEDVTDVRFSAGARKLEVYAGLWQHLLKDIDPDGREIYARVLSEYPSPLDIRLVGMCTAKDMFGHVPMDFSSFAEEVREVFSQAGYSGEWLAENVENHGVDLDAWDWKTPGDKERVVPPIGNAVKNISAGKVAAISRSRSRETSGDSTRRPNSHESGYQDATQRCHIGQKIAFFAFGNNLGEIAESIRRRFINAGLSTETIDANAYSFGGDIGSWKGLDGETKERLLREIGPARHVFVTEARGIFAKDRYEAAVCGADFLDLGIPDGELLDLIDNLPKLLSLMKGGTEKPLLFVDGTSGARRFGIAFRHATAKEKVQELFALDDRIHYGCMGIGREEVRRWKEEMNRERRDSRALLTAILERRTNDAREALGAIAARLRQQQTDEEFIRQEIAARQFNVWRPYYRYATERVSAVMQGLPVERLDFGTFLVLGGRWLLGGVLTEAEFEQTREDFRFALDRKTEPKGTREIVEHCFRPKYVPAEEEYREVSTGVSGSLKAVEEMGVKLQTREIRRQQLEQARRLNRRRRAFQQEMETPATGIDEDYARAISRMGPADITEEKFGTFLGLTKKVWQQIVDTLLPDTPFRSECRQELDSTFGGGELLDTEYASLERKGARIFELGDRAAEDLVRIAKALELLDIAQLIEKVIYADDGIDVWKAVARFFDSTLNNHIFDYIPYHYHSERTHAFKDWSRDRLLAFAVERHAFLHEFLIDLLSSRSDLAGRSQEYRDLLLGRFDRDRGLRAIPLGVDVAGDVEQRWFAYARLRDLATLIFDGYPLPQIEQDFQLPDHVNVGIIYPVGNTTVCVALEQAPRLFEQGVNLFMAPFPKIAEVGGRKVLTAREIFFRNRDGTWILARLQRPAVVHAIWFHFTHFLRPEIESVRAPIIQPLLWEAATYLKCALPGMMKGSGYSCPDQQNWYRRRSDEMSPEKARRQIEGLIRDLAARHRILIVKAEKESGGRRALILPVKDKRGSVIAENVKALAELVHEISQTDNAVIQEVIPSKVRRLYSAEFLDLVKERFITELGIGIQDDTPFYSYFRMVVVKRPDNEYRITHGITVVSTAGIANVGQGGRLFEYRDEKIDPKFRQDLRDELTQIALSSLKSQEQYIAAHREEIFDSYREVHERFVLGEDLVLPHANLLDVPDHEILFEMGDYMPVLLVDDEDHLINVYDHQHEQFVSVSLDGRPNPKLKFYDAKGNKLTPPVKLFSNGRRRKLFWQYGRGKKQRARPITVVKIECNPGAGLWRPHNDRLKTVDRDGEGVFQIFEVLGQWGKKYKQKIT